MIVVNAKMITNDENLELLKREVKSLEIETRKEDGCIDYAFSIEMYESNIVRITELWDNLESLKNHLKTEHVVSFIEAMSVNPTETEAHFYESNEFPLDF